MNTIDSTPNRVSVKSVFRAVAVDADLLLVVDFVNGNHSITEAVAFAKGLSIRQQHVMTRLLEAQSHGLSIRQCGERLASAIARQFDLMAEVA
jgi:hypothetical protein